MLHTEYRPTSWAGFIGNAKAVKIIRGTIAIHARKVAESRAKDGLAFQIIGLSGAGKTTAAQLLAREVGAGPDTMDYMEIDGDKCGAEAVRRLEQDGFLATRPWGKRKVVVVNEHLRKTMED